MTNDPVTRLLEAVAAGTGVPGDLYAPDAVLDATVPMWRFEVHGGIGIAEKLSQWYDVPGTLTELARTPAADGEAVRFTLDCVEQGEPWATHQSHFFVIAGGRIVRHEAWCGGRWSAALLADIEAGLQSARAAS